MVNTRKNSHPRTQCREELRNVANHAKFENKRIIEISTYSSLPLLRRKCLISSYPATHSRNLSIIEYVRYIFSATILSLEFILIFLHVRLLIPFNTYEENEILN